MSIKVKLPIKLDVTVEELDKDGNVIRREIVNENDVKSFLMQKEGRENGSIRKSSN